MAREDRASIQLTSLLIEGAACFYGTAHKTSTVSSVSVTLLVADRSVRVSAA